MNLVDAIRKEIKPYKRPAVYISGGLDSTIVLHHLREQMPNETIYTYTLEFGTSWDEVEDAQKIAEHYETDHTTILAHRRRFIDELPTIQKIFDRPRFNIWPWFLASRAGLDHRKNIYIGEGSDEHFGGYNDRNYMEGWAGQLIYVIPTFRTIHKHFGLNLNTPFYRIAATTPVSECYNPPHKKLLRDAYRDILPMRIITKLPHPPGFCKYDEYWMGDSMENAKFNLMKYVIKVWLEVHK